MAHTRPLEASGASIHTIVRPGLYVEIALSELEDSLRNPPPRYRLDARINSRDPGFIYYCAAHGKIYETAGALKNHLERDDHLDKKRFDLLKALDLIWVHERPPNPQAVVVSGPDDTPRHLDSDPGANMLRSSNANTLADETDEGHLAANSNHNPGPGPDHSFDNLLQLDDAFDEPFIATALMAYLPPYEAGDGEESEADSTESAEDNSTERIE